MLTESDRKFFQPKWRRIAATAFCIGWSVVEWTSGEAFWGCVAIAFTLYCLWQFFYKFNQTDTSAE